MGTEENVSYVEYIQSIRLRFLQERTVGLDLYHSGTLGILVFCLVVASATIFLLALFQAIPKRRHIVAMLVALGSLAFLLGVVASYLNFRALPTRADEIIRAAAGNAPVTRGQEAAIIALPLLLGGFTLVMNLLGCLYLGLFWGGSLLPRSGRQRR